MLNTAVRRATKWISFQSIDSAMPMRGQIGGVSFGKKPVLTLKPDYILKPLHSDHRGFREIAFYEAIQLAYQSINRKGSGGAAVAAAALITAGGVDYGLTKDVGNDANSVIDSCDTLAMRVAEYMQDAVVAKSGHTVISSWRIMMKEIELLRRLSTFTPPYYGIMGQELIVSNPTETPSTPPSPKGLISSSAHLLLSDATANFSRPCAIDLKMGQQSYEPDAPRDKCEREIRKYPQQKEFGFRIVGMRIYDPEHPESDKFGFKRFDKFFGRSRHDRESVENAFRSFFSIAPSSCEQMYGGNENEERCSLSSSEKVNCHVRTRVIMNLLAQLRVVRGWFEENTALAFYSSSILMVYEGDMSVGSNRDVTDLKMIDFSHVRRQAGGDSGYLHGIDTVFGILKAILQEA